MSFCHAGEYKEARRFCLGDIDGDGTDDIAVRYTLESFCGGNNTYFYMAVFLKRATEYKLAAFSQVGGDGIRGVDFDTIEKGKIYLTTDEYLPGDCVHCPSGKGRTTYILKDGMLVESDWAGEAIISPIERFRHATDLHQPHLEDHR